MDRERGECGEGERGREGNGAPYTTLSSCSLWSYRLPRKVNVHASFHDCRWLQKISTPWTPPLPISSFFVLFLNFCFCLEFFFFFFGLCFLWLGKWRGFEAKHKEANVPIPRTMTKSPYQFTPPATKLEGNHLLRFHIKSHLHLIFI